MIHEHPSQLERWLSRRSVECTIVALSIIGLALMLLTALAWGPIVDSIGLCK